MFLTTYPAFYAAVGHVWIPSSILNQRYQFRNIVPYNGFQIKNDGKDGPVTSQDVALVSKPPSKLPVPEKARTDVLPPATHYDNTTDMLTKVVGLETLYAVLSEEHLGLQMSVQEAWRVANAERAKRRALEQQLEAAKTAQEQTQAGSSHAQQTNPINLALAQRIEELQKMETQLRQENGDLKEELELLEFRILEMDSSPKRTVSRASDTRCDVIELDDVSDSGVMSLPTSEDDPQEFSLECERERDIKCRMMEMCKSIENVADRICLQQAVALIRHYEARMEALESSMSTMNQETTTGRNPRSDNSEGGNAGGGRIIATVLPFTDPGTERQPEKGRGGKAEIADCLQESGIFEEEEHTVELVTQSTQTYFTETPPGDLSQEIRKLTQIRERIEEQGTNKKLVLGPGGDYTPTLKEVLFYRERLETLEGRLRVYESSGDAQTKQLAARIEKETRLAAEVGRLKDRIARLEQENRHLEEERCELEEAENDTRLRCQKLELKLSALGEKKSCLKVQLQQATRLVSTLRNSMAEEEKKKVEARQHANRLEALVHSYEQKNFELEEREMEVKYRLQMLENTMPALMMWNMWRMMCAMQGTTGGGSVQMGLPPGLRPESATVDSTKGINAKEEELLVKLKALETKLGNENRLLEESRLAEEGLRRKVRELETMLNRKDDDIIEILDRDPEEDVEVFEKLGKMVRDRMDLDKRIKDLEMKEKLYQETLQQADTMFAEMEGGLTKQIREKDVELEEKESELQEIEAELVESQSRLKKASMFSEISEHLQEKIEALESEVTRLREDLNKRERERQALELEEKRLQKELQNCEEQLDSIKQTVEKPLRADLESEKRKSKALEGQLEAAEEEAAKREEDHASEVSKLKRQISRLTRDMLENDVTISELREEVQTLETTVGELRFSLKATKESREDLKKLLESEVERRDKTIEELRKSISEKPKKSLKEELEEVPKEMIEQEIVSSKGEFRRTSVEEVLAQESQQQQALEVIKEEAEEDVGEPVAEKPGIDESDAEMTEGERRLAIQQIESQVDSEATSLEIQSDEDLAKRRDKRSTDCQIAQNAVAGVSGKDLKGTISNLTKAYHHSLTCKECGETLGSFLEELIQQLGVKLPRVKKMGEHDDPEYGGQSSTMKTKEMGPGTVMWDPKDNDAGYRIRPTVSALALTVEELEDKCRVKDHMIQKMADELRHLGRCANWSGTNLMEAVADRPHVDIDFDRRALCTYLKSLPPHGLATVQEKKGEDVEYAATNPLGLSVVRQVGPDSLLLQWAPPPLNKKVFAFEIFINGLFIQRVRCPGRNKALIHPIDLSEKVYITLNAVTYTGEPCDAVTIQYP